MRRNSVLSAALLLGAMFLCGCGDDGHVSGPTPCEFTEDCPAGYECVTTPEGRFCIAAPDAGTTPPDGQIFLPAMELNPVSLDFGNPLLGSPIPLDLTISNSGQADLIIHDLSIIEDDLVDEYTFQADGLPITVTPQGQIVVTVTLTPVDAEEDFGYLLIASNDPNRAAVLVPLSIALAWLRR